MKDKKYLGSAIRTHRKMCSMSQAELAKVTGMARTTIVAIEQDKRAVTEHEITNFETALFMDKGSLIKIKAVPQLTRVHVYFGHRTGKRERGEKCFYCGSKPSQMYYTYFGAPLCASCWDNDWRKTEEGESDPPSEKINNTSSGKWL